MNLKLMTKISLFSVIVYLSVLFIKFPIYFLTLDIKCALIVLFGLVFGLYPAILVTIISTLLETITISSTGIIGMVMNFTAIFSYVIPIIIISKNFINNKKLFLGIFLGTTLMSISMILLNIILTPIYLGVPLNDVFKLLLTLIIPFNIFKGILNGLLIIFTKNSFFKILKKFNIM